MAELPLYDGPGETPIERIGLHSPEHFAYWVGVRQGYEGQSETRRYDEDERIDRYYHDGHRLGRLFRPLPCMQGRASSRRGWRR